MSTLKKQMHRFTQKNLELFTSLTGILFFNILRTLPKFP